MKKPLIVYFSRAGEQYSVGEISEGNTKIVAKIIAQKTGGDLFEIKVLEDNYPNKYSPLIQYAKEEKQLKIRPALIGKIENFDDYDTVFLGYPNWWGDMPMPVYSFLESYDFSGKTVHHFCTHEGSGSLNGGFAIYGHIAQKDKAQTERKIDEWLESL